MNPYKFNVGDYVKIKAGYSKQILYRHLLIELKPDYVINRIYEEKWL